MSEQDSIFSRRFLVAWVAASVTIFAVALYVAAHGETDAVDSIGPTVESRSALGYAGIFDILDRLETPVVHTRYRSLERLDDGGVLVIAEPRLDQANMARAHKLLHAKSVLLILPKWQGVESDKHPGWIENADLISFYAAQTALDLVDTEAQLVRGPASTVWDRNVIGVKPMLTAPMQFIRSKKLTPIVAHDDQILVGEYRHDDRRIFVLADPDVLSNHGLDSSGNAAFAIALIGALRTGDGPVVFDEALNGAAGNGPNILNRLFKLPLLPGTILSLIAAALLLWATVPRFGAPDPAAPALESGKRGLIDTIAALVGFSGQRSAMVARFIDATLHDVARQLRAPRGLSGDALIAWLKRVGEARGVDSDSAAWLDRADMIRAQTRPDPAMLVSLARGITRWKQDIINGSGKHQARSRRAPYGSPQSDRRTG